MGNLCSHPQEAENILEDGKRVLDHAIQDSRICAQVLAQRSRDVQSFECDQTRKQLSFSRPPHAHCFETRRKLCHGGRLGPAMTVQGVVYFIPRQPHTSRVRTIKDRTKHFFIIAMDHVFGQWILADATPGFKQRLPEGISVWPVVNPFGELCSIEQPVDGHPGRGYRVLLWWRTKRLILGVEIDNVIILGLLRHFGSTEGRSERSKSLLPIHYPQRMRCRFTEDSKRTDLELGAGSVPLPQEKRSDREAAVDTVEQLEHVLCFPSQPALESRDANFPTQDLGNEILHGLHPSFRSAQQLGFRSVHALHATRPSGRGRIDRGKGP